MIYNVSIEHFPRFPPDSRPIFPKKGNVFSRLTYPRVIGGLSRLGVETEVSLLFC